MPPTTTTKGAPRKYGGKSKWDLRALGVSTKPSRKSKACGANAKVGAAKPAVATKPANVKPGTTKVSNSTKASDSVHTNDEKSEKMNKEPVNINVSNEGSKVQDREVMEMFRKFQEAQAAEAQAASDGCDFSGVSTVSETSTAFGIPDPSNAFCNGESTISINDKPSFDFGISDSSNIFGTPDSSNILGAPSTFNTLATPETSNIFGLRESQDIFEDKPSFNFATTSSGDLVLLDSQGSKVSVLGTYSIPAKDRMPTFEGEVDFFRDWTQEQLDEEQHAPINDRKAARLRLRRKRYDFVGGPGYRVYLARRERHLTEDEDDFLPRKRMHTTQDLANMRAKWRVRRERPLRERAMRRCLRMKCALRGCLRMAGAGRVVGREVGKDADKARKGEREVNKVEEEDGDKTRQVDVERKVFARLKADGSMGDDGCQVDEVYAVGGEEQAMDDGDDHMGAEDQPMDIDQAEDEEENDEDDDADTPRAPFRRESTPEPEGEEDWIM